jgi:hypothetical protein
LEPRFKRILVLNVSRNSLRSELSGTTSATQIRSYHGPAAVVNLEHVGNVDRVEIDYTSLLAAALRDVK